MAKPKIGIIYDFDKTLCTDDMQSYTFIKNLDMEPKEFWGEAARVTNTHQVEGILSYMFVMIRECKKRGIPLTEEYLNKCGENVVLFKGVSTWFDRINEFARRVKAGETLTQAELEERAALRTEYLREFRASLGGILDNTVIVREDGTKERVSDRKVDRKE